MDHKIGGTSSKKSQEVDAGSAVPGEPCSSADPKERTSPPVEEKPRITFDDIPQFPNFQPPPIGTPKVEWKKAIKAAKESPGHRWRHQEVQNIPYK